MALFPGKINLNAKGKSKDKPFVLDIGDSGVRLAGAARGPEGIEIKHLSFKDFPAQSEPIDRLTLADSIRDLVRESGIDSRRVAVNLYGTDPIIKFLNLPFMAGDEIKKAIKWEASKFIVYDLEKMILDYAVLGEEEDAGKKKLNVLVVAAARESVLDEITLLKESGLEPDSIEVDILAQFAVLQASETFKKNENIVFIEIGARKTNITVIDSGVPCFKRECLSIGSLDIDKALKNDLQVDLSQAKRIKQEFILDINEPENDRNRIIHNAIIKVLDRAIMEIRRSLDYYIDSFPQKNIDRALLAGGGACLKHIDVFLSRILGMPVEIVDVFKGLRLADSIGERDAILASPARFCTVVGLALGAIS